MSTSYGSVSTTLRPWQSGFCRWHVCAHDGMKPVAACVADVAAKKSAGEFMRQDRLRYVGSERSLMA